MSEREAFEKWAVEEMGCRNLTMHDGEVDDCYYEKRLQTLWMGWQAACEACASACDAMGDPENTQWDRASDACAAACRKLKG
jgi:hypothetical protein